MEVFDGIGGMLVFKGVEIDNIQRVRLRLACLCDQVGKGCDWQGIEREVIYNG